MSEQIKLEIDQGIATITINRPEKLNAFTDEMLETWLAALEQCRTSAEVRVIVMTGTGRAFTTGGDTGTFADSASRTPAVIKARLAEGAQRLPRKILEIDKPVIAALNGFATGGGLDVALACDIRFAAESARVAETYVRMGLIPGVGGAWLLPRIVGQTKALQMFWTGDWVDAREAERIGLVTQVFPDDELQAATQAFARRLADGPPLSLQLIKRIMRFGQDKDFAAAQEFVAANLPIVRTSEDHQEALAALKEKRTPRFNGR